MEELIEQDQDRKNIKLGENDVDQEK